MSGQITTDTQAALLLTARLGPRDEASAKPLTPRLYSLLLKWLDEHSLKPGDLLDDDSRRALDDLPAADLDRSNLERLLQRGTALALLVERWSSSGLWITSRTDADYPRCMAEYLENSAPPVLYGVGELGLLSKGGLAIVGSRHASEDDLEYARRVASACAGERIGVLSGAAKGVDAEAMTAALDAGGTAVGVLAEGLARASVAGAYHETIMDGRLTLVSAYEPESRWMTYAAMERNKLIYALADAALVVSCAEETGGTWAGASEALKRRRVTVYVKASGEVQPGNSKLQRMGAVPFPEEPWSNLEQTLQAPPVPKAANLSLFE